MNTEIPLYIKFDNEEEFNKIYEKILSLGIYEDSKIKYNSRMKAFVLRYSTFEPIRKRIYYTSEEKKKNIH